MAKDYEVLNELTFKTQELHRAIFDKGYEQGQKDILEQEPCEDAISRQAVIEKAVYTETEEGWSGMTVDVKDIEALPPVTPKEKIGHWTRVTDKTGHLVWKCDCGWQQRFNTNFCPDCGAKMIEPQESEISE